MASNNGFYIEVLPFTAMVAMECINVGLNTLYKAATNKGMSNHVFVVYSYGVAALLLLPSPFFSNRSRLLPPLNCSILAKIFLLGVIGLPLIQALWTAFTVFIPSIWPGVKQLHDPMNSLKSDDTRRTRIG